MKRLILVIAGLMMSVCLHAQYKVQYWLDGHYDAHTDTIIGIGTTSMQLDFGDSQDGLHTLYLRFGNDSTADLHSYIFYKTPTQQSTSGTIGLHYCYSIDGGQRQAIDVYPSNGLIHLDLDVSDFPTGLHTLGGYLLSGDGGSSPLYRSIFYKVPDGGAGIARYEYWFNDDLEHRINQDVSPVADPLQLVALLPVDTLPIRPQCFHFNPNDGHPLVQAKNEAHFRFWDTEQRCSEASRMFVDERVSSPIVADTFERNTTRTIPTPCGDEIHWFKLSAGIGDSLAFRVGSDAAVRLFSPSGAEVYTASGTAATNWDGCHAWEDGDYYLAVHSANCDESQLEVCYQWIYKYAVLKHSPTLVGNAPSLVTVHLLGNGYDKLSNISFFNADQFWQKDSIIASDINEVYADFLIGYDLEEGLYDMLLEFTNTDGLTDSLVVPNAITVEAAHYGEVVLHYESASSFTKPHIISLDIYNSGNVPYLGVPIIMAYTETGFARIYFSDQYLYLDSIEVIENCYHQAYDLFGNGVRGNFIPLMVNRLGPYQQMSIEIEFDCPRGTFFDFYAWPGTPWSSVILNNSDTENEAYSLLYTHKELFTKASMCDIPNPCDVAGAAECLCGESIGIVKLLAGSLAAPVLKGRRDMQKWYYDQGGEGQIYGDSRLQTPESILRDAMEHCAPEKAKRAVSIFFTAWDVLDGDDCPAPDPIHPGVPSPPIDPNEIIGFTNASGNYFVGKYNQILPYNIEFENDSLLAAGLAHVVVVKDTLDGSVFDLASLKATAFAIGDKVVTVDNGQSFIRTVDMRPAVNVLAQVKLDYKIDSTFAVATWTFTSLDPMTLLPTTADTLGFLAIGGTGEVNFTINRRADLADSTLIANRAWITFDNEQPIATSTWVNIVDNTPPVSQAVSLGSDADGRLLMGTVAEDALSGVWRYSLYGTLGETDVLLGTGMAIDSVVAVDTTLLHFDGFYTLAVDSAGNHEQRHLAPVQYTLTLSVSDTAMGTATGGGSYAAGTSISIEAVPASCHHFVAWDDGDAANPRQVVVNSDTAFTALFATNVPIATQEAITACDNWQGHTADTVLATTYTSAEGCDSTHSILLTINHSVATQEAITACDNWQGNTSDTVLTATYSSAIGCDSTHTVLLTVNHGVSTQEAVTACDEWQGHTADTVLTTTYTSAEGCDSIHTMLLTINHSTEREESMTVAEADLPLEYEGLTIADSGMYTLRLATAEGCDSVVNLRVTVLTTGLEVAVGPQDIRVYPNPTRGTLTVEAEGILRIEVLDSHGRTAARAEGSSTIDLAALPVGSYMLRITLDKGIRVQKVVKQ